MQMRKIKSAILMLVFTLAFSVAIFANPMEDVPTKLVDDVVFVPLRITAYAHNMDVQWDEAIRTVLLVNSSGTLPVSVSEVGGFIEEGTSWIPYEFAVSIFSNIVEHELFQMRAPAFSTDLDHGLIALGHIEFMTDNLYNRSAFTYREKEAALWIVEELLAMGHSRSNIEVQEFTFDQTSRWADRIGIEWDAFALEPIIGGETIRASQQSQNIILTVPGQSERIIVVGAHYDTPHYNSFPFSGYDLAGASDNASGVALLLESAQRILEQDNYYTVVYVFFGAEEVGILGSHFYVHSLTQQEQDNITLMVNADVLFEGPYFVYGVGSSQQFVDFMEEFATMEVIAPFIYEMIGLDISDLPLELLHEIGILEMFAYLIALGLAEVDAPSLVSYEVSYIAKWVNYHHGLDLISIPRNIFVTSDNLPFLEAGHIVVNLVGFERLENVNIEELYVQTIFFDEFVMKGLLHTPQDNFHYINYNWPGLMEDAMRTFSIFLEEILLARFS